MSDKGYIFDSEDMEVWGDALKGIKKLENTKPKLVKSVKFVAENLEPMVNIAGNISVATEAKNPSDYSYALTIGDGKRINSNMLKSITKGKYKIDATLDLHGCTKEQAHNELTCFLDDACQRKYRMLLIITGKGNSSFQNHPVLKNNLLSWLMDSAFRCSILYINYAHAKHGGHGAFYVLLKR
jgi:DNA-nicking Smr family endonuclease